LSVIIALLICTWFVLAALIVFDTVSWRRKQKHFSEHCFERNWDGLAQVKV